MRDLTKVYDTERYRCTHCAASVGVSGGVGRAHGELRLGQVDAHESWLHRQPHRRHLRWPARRLELDATAWPEIPNRTLGFVFRVQPPGAHERAESDCRCSYSAPRRGASGTGARRRRSRAWDAPTACITCRTSSPGQQQRVASRGPSSRSRGHPRRRATGNLESRTSSRSWPSAALVAEAHGPARHARAIVAAPRRPLWTCGRSRRVGSPA